MRVICPRCRTEYEFDTTRVSHEGTRVKCSSCQNVFTVYPPDAVEAQARRSLDSGPQVSVSGTPSILLAQGERVYRVRDLATLQRWIIEKRVLATDRVAMDGETFEQVADRAELKPFLVLLEQLRETRKELARERERATSLTQAAPVGGDLPPTHSTAEFNAARLRAALGEGAAEEPEAVATPPATAAAAQEASPAPVPASTPSQEKDAASGEARDEAGESTQPAGGPSPVPAIPAGAVDTRSNTVSDPLLRGAPGRPVAEPAPPAAPPEGARTSGSRVTARPAAPPAESGDTGRKGAPAPSGAESPPKGTGGARTSPAPGARPSGGPGGQRPARPEARTFEQERWDRSTGHRGARAGSAADDFDPRAAVRSGSGSSNRWVGGALVVGVLGGIVAWWSYGRVPAPEGAPVTGSVVPTGEMAAGAAVRAAPEPIPVPEPPDTTPEEKPERLASALPPVAPARGAATSGRTDPPAVREAAPPAAREAPPARERAREPRREESPWGAVAAEARPAATPVARTSTEDARREGDGHASAGRHADAVDSYRRALAASPKDTALLVKLGWSEVELGRNDDAVRSFQMAIRLNSSLASAHYGLAYTLQKMGQADRAVEAYNTCIGLDNSAERRDAEECMALRDALVRAP